MLYFLLQPFQLPQNLTYTKPGGPGSGAGNSDDGKCELIGTFSLFTQAVLGVLCVSSLLAKRYFYEYPIRRTWPVWCFDVSKQLIGAFGVHIFNVILSMLKTAPEFVLMMRRNRNGGSNGGNGGDGGGDGGDDDNDTSDNDDPCDWYFLSIVLDCTIGVYILYLVFKSMNYILKHYFRATQINSGEYGNVNHPSFRAFAKQLAVYFSSLMITKIILYGIVEIFERQLLWITSHILLAWLDEYPDEFEIFMVMFIIPIVMNCLQLILIDNFIRNQMWVDGNKLLSLRFPKWDLESASVRKREIDEIIGGEQAAEAEAESGRNDSSRSKNSADVGEESISNTDGLRSPRSHDYGAVNDR